MQPVIQLNQSITHKCNKMIKSKFLDDLFLNSVEANTDKWQVNFEQVGQNEVWPKNKTNS